MFADAKWVDFIIGQVLENSAKYGAKTVRFEGAVKDAGTKDGCIELLISDDGDGIPAADVPRVFDRGFTGSQGRAHHKATGMGLYLAAVACERMGLGLRVSSEEGGGYDHRAHLPARPHAHGLGRQPYKTVRLW